MASARPQLYTTDAAQPPRLCGKRCRACGYTFFPPHAYSCESCGAAAEQIEPRLLAGSGVLHASATVHVHHDPSTPTPFTVASISLDDGPGRFTVQPENFELLRLPGWHVELMLHLMNADAEFPPHSQPLTEVVRTLVEEVGAGRLAWGSDMPCCERTVTYKQSLLLFQTRCDFLSGDERDAILGGNLERLYPAA